MTGSPRAAKLAQRIKVVMAQALTKVVRDDAMESVTVTDARVTNDLQNATVYYTVFGDDEQKAYVAELAAGAEYAGDADPYKEAEEEA